MLVFLWWGEDIGFERPGQANTTPVTRNEAHGVQDQIVNIRRSVKERQLEDLNEQRATHTGGDDLPMGVQLSESWKHQIPEAGSGR